MVFRTPIRRQTRQRSGFNVAGNTPGSECKIKRTGRLDISNRRFTVKFYKKDITANPIFEDEKGILCFGAYVKPKKNLELTLDFKYEIGSSTQIVSRTIPLYAKQWNKVGIIVDIKIIKPTQINVIECEFKLVSNDENIGIVDFFGINMGAIDYSYFIENEVEEIFYEKIIIYIPEISYHQYDQVQHIPSSIPLKFSEGEPIIIKSCNRCSRFLLVDALNERNTVSFSNHCVKKAPCTHNAFSRYIIKENEYTKIPKEISQIWEDDKIKLYHGFQLECKSCKKFFVNAPLNPLRNSTQHREDSLRRRSIEVLVDTLLGREWIYHKFRLENKKEFDKYIWEKFQKKCFKCDKVITNSNEMDLDHTRPLASFWPLDEDATCLCKKCNSLKSDKFPIEFYSESELHKLSKVTGLSIALLSQKKANEAVIKKLIEKIDWFFDEFLNNKDYQKIREGKKTSDLIYKAILKQIQTFYDKDADLVELYKRKTKKLPKSITL